MVSFGNSRSVTEYLQWQSDLNLAQVFAQDQSFSFASIIGDRIYYLTTVAGSKNEKERTVLMCQSANETDCLTPPPYSLRTLISEYGGKPYWINGSTLYFVNLLDQCLYRQNLNTKLAKGKPIHPQRVSPQLADDQLAMYADVQILNQNCVLAIAEMSRPGSDNQSFIVSIKSPTQKLNRLVEGADFYSNLVVNCEQTKVAWVQWDHPAMPWDMVELWQADLINIDDQLSFGNSKRVPLEQGANICQLAFADNGSLFFVADYPQAGWRNFWNIYCLDTDQTTVTPVTQFEQEFGYPHWQYGDQRLVRFDQDRLLSFASEPNGDKMYVIDCESLQVTLVTDQCGVLQSLCSDGKGNAVVTSMQKDRPPCLLSVNRQLQIQTTRQVDSVLEPGNISLAEHIRFPTRSSEHSYGYYYAPTNSAYRIDSGSKPPLIVMVHGGPTARCYGYFDIQKQFWTTRGFAILDVNHRGSCGYGRAFRDALYGNWGVMDIDDIIDAIEHLINHNKVDADNICIRGKSAGGYAVLKALTDYPQWFKAGACYYGIGNLLTLAQTTHKFEKHYTDTLIGEAFEPERAKDPDSLYYQRSPINYMQQIQSAMILFQGLDDKIVTPQVADEITAVLSDLNLPHQYETYVGEGHGFKRKKTNIDAWSKELAFYQKVLSS